MECRPVLRRAGPGGRVCGGCGDLESVEIAILRTASALVSARDPRRRDLRAPAWTSCCPDDGLSARTLARGVVHQDTLGPHSTDELGDTRVLRMRLVRRQRIRVFELGVEDHIERCV